MHQIRIYHVTLAVLATLAYLTGDDDGIHAWLGYAVALVVVLRLLWALTGNPHVGLMRFYPQFEGLNLSNAFTHPAITKTFMLGIAVSLLSVTSTGILMDQGKTIGLANAELVAAAYADDDDHHHKKHGKDHHKESFYEEALEEVHEFFGNLLLIFVGLHVSYLLLFKRPLAKFMLFMPKKKSSRAK
jgi:cytochrome b